MAAVDFWTAPVVDGGMERLDRTGANGPPLSVWRKPGVAAKAIILVGHGGSQHRKGEFVKALARELLDRLPAYVVAIDGPVHGERLVGDEAGTRDAFVRLWLSEDGGAPAMAADWAQALAAVRSLDGCTDLPVGYYGVSMGTAYGVPMIAGEPAVRAAALGMWQAQVGGTTHLLEAAPRVLCPVLFVHREADEFFSLEGARELFDLLGTSDKSFRLLPGPHEETLDQIAMAADFLAERLGD